MRKTVLHAALLALTSPISAFSLGLGQMTVQSALDQPFSAEIELIDIGNVPLKAIKVSVADPESFTEIGLERAAILSLLTLTITKNGQGKEVIKVESTERMAEPYMDLVVDLAWPQGQLYKAYTILLDPPGYHLVSTTIKGSTTHYVSHTKYNDQPGVIDKTVITQVNHHSAQTNENKKQSTYGPTVPNENIWQIAQRYKTEDTILPQVVLAIVGANLNAFTDGNLNGLKVGERLTIPATSEIRKIAAELATAEAMVHDKAWNNKTFIDHVLTPPYTNNTPVVEKNTQYSPNTTPNSSGDNFSIAPISPPSDLPQFIPHNNTSLIAKSIVHDTISQEGSSKAEVSITVAAIESLREANASLVEQLHLLQKQNNTLQKQLGQRNGELKELRTKIQVLSKQHQALSSHASSTQYDDTLDLWPIILLLLITAGGTGFAYWHFKVRPYRFDDKTIPEDVSPQPAEPASFIVHREENHEIINTEKSNNPTIELGQLKPIDKPKEEQMVVEVINIPETPDDLKKKEEQLVVDKEQKFATEQQDSTNGIKEDEELISLEFAPIEADQHSSDYNDDEVLSKEERTPEPAEEVFLEFETGLHNSLTSAVETDASNEKDEIKELTLDGIDFVSPLEPVIEKNTNNKVEQHLEVGDELKQFFVEEDSPNEESKFPSEESTSGLLKSQKALDTLIALAKTYISMDDFESARNALNEVLEHGTQKQKEEAARLLEEINNK